ncbi:MAG: PQQ-dependent sugar dehydrogenase [Cyclobacteriaceae bacterium]|nr:PQQ-dependent sugar dehydrogenase [Cyclobacteriaceae bacterium]MCH8514908.1 PQQ-dependent sugar dehydrogenase [Cyclobacteriaceae bacterium]
MKKYIFYFLSIFILNACEAKSDADVVVEEEKEVANSFDFEVKSVYKGMAIPWAMAWLPDGRMLITERSGTLHLFDEASGEMQTISGIPEVYASGQGGLLDVVLHPDYDSNGWIYLSYAKPMEGGGNTTIVRGKLSEGNAFVEQEEIFMATPGIRRGVHFGSRIAFDDSNYLFFTIGDRGTMENAQKLDNYFGKVHRIHDDGRIPNDNPFINEANAKKTIWTYGNRNIQGMRFHPSTGELWAHEHGPKGGDEINHIRKGLNYGWPKVSYGINYDGTTFTDKTEAPGIEPPVHQWTPSIAPCGMTFVSGDQYPEWKNNLLVGALSFQYVARVVLDDAGNYVREEKLLENIGRVRDVAMSPDGIIYVAVEGDAGIVKLVPKS